MPFHCLLSLYVFAIGLLVIGCGDNPIVDTQKDPVEDSSSGEGGVTITGQVLPPEVSPQVIVIRNGIDFTNAIVDEEGRYTISNLPAGDYSLQVIATGFFTDISINNLELKAGEIHGADLVILRERSEAAILLGQVVNQSNNQPLPDAEVQIECSTGVCAPLSAVSDQKGRFSIDIWSGLGSNINVWKPGYCTKPIHIEALNPGQKFNLNQIQLVPVAR